MVASYIGSIADKGTVAASSLQPYLSAINSMHSDFGFDKPALGHLIALVRRGLSRTQARAVTRDTRIPLPADIVEEVLDDTLQLIRSEPPALAPRPWAALLRRRFCFLLSFLFMGRQDTSTSLASMDIGIDDHFVWLRLAEKQRRHLPERRIVRISRHPPPGPHGPSRVPCIAAVAQAYIAAKDALGRGPTPWFFQLPGEPQPVTHSMSTWVAETLADVGAAAPPGFAYLGHSLRSGASSAAEAIKVPRARGDWLGGWAPGSNTRERHYIDPTVGPSPSAFRLLGWLLDSHYEALLPARLAERAISPHVHVQQCFSSSSLGARAEASFPAPRGVPTPLAACRVGVGIHSPSPA